MERNPRNPQNATRRRGTWDLSQVQVIAVLKCKLRDLGQTTSLPVSASGQGKEEQYPPLDVMRAKRKQLPQSTSSRGIDPSMNLQVQGGCRREGRRLGVIALWLAKVKQVSASIPTRSSFITFLPLAGLSPACVPSTTGNLLLKLPAPFFTLSGLPRLHPLPQASLGFSFQTAEGLGAGQGRLFFLTVQMS